MAYWPVFDEFRKSFFIGELIWNFADFQTAQGKSQNTGRFFEVLILLFF